MNQNGPIRQKARLTPISAFVVYTTILVSTTIATSYLFDRQITIYLLMCFLLVPSMVAATFMRVMRHTFGKPYPVPGLAIGVAVAIIYLALTNHEVAAGRTEVGFLPVLIGFFLGFAWHKVSEFIVRILVWDQFQGGGSFSE